MEPRRLIASFLSPLSLSLSLRASARLFPLWPPPSSACGGHAGLRSSLSLSLSHAFRCSASFAAARAWLSPRAAGPRPSGGGGGLGSRTKAACHITCWHLHASNALHSLARARSRFPHTPIALREHIRHRESSAHIRHATRRTCHTLVRLRLARTSIIASPCATPNHFFGKPCRHCAPNLAEPGGHAQRNALLPNGMCSQQVVTSDLLQRLVPIRVLPREVRSHNSGMLVAILCHRQIRCLTHDMSSASFPSDNKVSKLSCYPDRGVFAKQKAASGDVTTMSC